LRPWLAPCSMLSVDSHKVDIWRADPRDRRETICTLL
jgi:hypothetical protein